MSTLKATNIKNESSASNNIVLDSGGGVVVSGILTATTFSGDGSGLSGIDATQIVTGNTSVQTVDTGSDGHVKINTEGAERVRVDSSGNVGISTSNITYKFEISHASNTNKWAFNPGNLSNTNSLYSLTNNGATPATARFEASTTGFHFYPGNSEIARIDSNGIKFNGDTAAANALDDYEEGTWTPKDLSGVTLADSIGYYTKIGRFVQLFVSFQGTSLNGKTGISNFPYTGAATQYNGHVNLGYVMWSGGSVSPPFTPTIFYLYQNSIGGYTSAQFANRPGSTQWANTDYQSWTCTYMTA